MQKSKVYYILMVFSIFLMLTAILLNNYFSFSVKQIAQNASKKIVLKQYVSEETLNKLLSDSSVNTNPVFENAYTQHEIGIYLFKNDSLVYWNNAQIPFNYDKKLFEKPFGIARLKQGYYLYFKSQKLSATGLALCLVKPDYDLQNNYLKNTFSQWTDIPKELNIANNGQSENAVVLNRQQLFFLSGNDSVYYSITTSNIFFTVFLTGFITLLVLILILVKHKPGGLQAFVWLVIILAFRFFYDRI